LTYLLVASDAEGGSDEQGWLLRKHTYLADGVARPTINPSGRLGKGVAVLVIFRPRSTAGKWRVASVARYQAVAAVGIRVAFTEVKERYESTI
jgi:hypothetical protein